jgi:hypothetical protein
LTLRVFPPTSVADYGAHEVPPEASAAGGGTLTIKDEGVTVGTPAGITSIDFVGGEVTATGAGAAATVTVPAVFPGAGNYGLVLATHLGYVKG